jgi:hypothetical protein
MRAESAKPTLRRIFTTATKERTWKLDVQFDNMKKVQKKIQNSINELRSLPERLTIAEEKLERIVQLQGTIDEMDEWSVQWTDLDGWDHWEWWSQKEIFEEPRQTTIEEAFESAGHG